MLPIVWTFAIIADIPVFIAAVCMLHLLRVKNRIKFREMVLAFYLQIIPIADL